MNESYINGFQSDPTNKALKLSNSLGYFTKEQRQKRIEKKRQEKCQEIRVGKQNYDLYLKGSESNSPSFITKFKNSIQSVRLRISDSNFLKSNRNDSIKPIKPKYHKLEEKRKPYEALTQLGVSGVGSILGALLMFNSYGHNLNNQTHTDFVNLPATTFQETNLQENTAENTQFLDVAPIFLDPIEDKTAI